MKVIGLSNVCDICGKPRRSGNHEKCSKLRQANLKKANTRVAEFVSSDGRIRHIETETPPNRNRKKKAVNNFIDYAEKQYD